MRSGDAAGRADEADDRRRLDGVAGLRVKLGQMRENREQPIAVIDHDRVAREVHRRRQDHVSIVRGADRRAGLADEIDARVRRAPLAVVVAACPEVARRSSVDRQHEGAGPPPGRGARVRLSERRAVWAICSSASGDGSTKPPGTQGGALETASAQRARSRRLSLRRRRGRCAGDTRRASCRDRCRRARAISAVARRNGTPDPPRARSPSSAHRRLTPPTSTRATSPGAESTARTTPEWTLSLRAGGAAPHSTRERRLARPRKP